MHAKVWCRHRLSAEYRGMLKEVNLSIFFHITSIYTEHLLG